LFVIMLIGVDTDEDISHDPVVGQRQLALLAGAGMLALVVIIGVAFNGELTGTAVAPAYPIGVAADADGVTVPPEDNIRQLARVLFTDYVFAFEITALLLTVAVVGAVVLARRPSGELAPLPEVEPPWPLTRSVAAAAAEDEGVAAEAEEPVSGDLAEPGGDQAAPADTDQAAH